LFLHDVVMFSNVLSKSVKDRSEVMVRMDRVRLNVNFKIDYMLMNIETNEQIPEIYRDLLTYEYQNNRKPNYNYLSNALVYFDIFVPYTKQDDKNDFCIRVEAMLREIKTINGKKLAINETKIVKRFQGDFIRVFFYNHHERRTAINLVKNCYWQQLELYEDFVPNSFSQYIATKTMIMINGEEESFPLAGFFQLREMKHLEKNYKYNIFNYTELDFNIDCYFDSQLVMSFDFETFNYKHLSELENDKNSNMIPNGGHESDQAYMGAFVFYSGGVNVPCYVVMILHNNSDVYLKYSSDQVLEEKINGIINYDFNRSLIEPKKIVSSLSYEDERYIDIVKRLQDELDREIKKMEHTLKVPVTVIRVDSEYDFYMSFAKIHRKLQPEIWTGHNILGYNIPFMLNHLD
ncbi:15250_t:CDS:2, partial [Gigaspora rosea]